MRRYSNNVFLLYDSDQAGLKATFRSGDVLLHEGAAVRVVSLPEGDDPDTFVAKQGAAGLEHELRKAVDVFDRKLQLLERGGWFADLHKARKAIDRLLPTIRAAVDPLTRDLYLSRAAQVSQVDRETLAREAAAMPDPITPPPPSFGESMDPGPREEGRPIGRARGRPTVRVGADAERMLLRAMLLFRGRLHDITARLDRIESEALDAGLSDLNGGEAVTFRDATLREIHSALVDAGADVGIEQLAEAIPAPMVPALEELTANAEEFVNLETIVEDNLITLEIRWRDELRTKLWAGRAELDTAGFAALTQQRDRLKREIMMLQARRGKRAAG
jgi:DNA primase